MRVGMLRWVGPFVVFPILASTSLTGCVGCDPELEPDWSDPNPLSDAGQVAELRLARRYLLFRPVLPPELGPPDEIWVTSRKFRRANALSAVYQHHGYGVFYVLQDKKGFGPEAVETLAAQFDDAPNVKAEVVPLRAGVDAALVEGCVTTFVTWGHDGVRFDVVGPSGGFSPDEAVKVARAFAAAAAAAESARESHLMSAA